MDPNISIITLGVEDLDVSTEFYREGLGLPEHEWDGDITFFETTGTWLAIYPLEALGDDADFQPEAPGCPRFTLAHNVDSQETVDDVLQEAKEAGAEITQPARDRDWGGYSGYFSDPDGFLWEVAWNPFFDVNE